MPDERRASLLREAIVRDRFIPPKIPASFRPKKMIKVVELLEKRHQDMDDRPPPEFDINASYDAINAEFEKTGSLRGLPPRLRRQAPWVFFAQVDKRPHLGQDPAKLKALFDLLHTHRRPRAVVSLLHRFLLYYPLDWKTWDQLRTGTKKLLGQKSQRLEGWRIRSSRFHYIERQGAAKFAKVALKDDMPLSEILTEARLTNELESGRFVRESYIEMLKSLRQTLGTPGRDSDVLSKILAFSLDSDGLRFEFCRGDLANALLEPFAMSEPDPEIRKEIESFLARHYGHPGVQPTRWLGVSRAAQDVMRRWLVGTTLDDFFLILDRTAQQGSQEANRWQYRRAFWGAYYRHGLIRDAWVAAGARARELLQRRRRSGMIQYANLYGGTANDCLLLLKIGGLTIAEWSHTGMCRFWLQGNKSSPHFYREYYEKNAIHRGDPDEAYRHDNSAAYSWQDEFASYIRANTGASVPEEEYLVE